MNFFPGRHEHLRNTDPLQQANLLRSPNFIPSILSEADDDDLFEAVAVGEVGGQNPNFRAPLLLKWKRYERMERYGKEGF